MGGELRVLSVGAARGLIDRIRDDFEHEEAVSLRCSFGPVGEIAAAVGRGEPFDVVVTSAPRLAPLIRDGRVAGDVTAPLGSVPTCLAVRMPDDLPDAAALARTFRDADAVYCPDLERATAGMHVLSVLTRLGIESEVRPRLRVFPHGAAAMEALARAPERAPVGCTQLTEIVATAGVRPAGALPPPYDLATVYSAAMAAATPNPESARRLVTLLTGERTAALRGSLGFQPTR